MQGEESGKNILYEDCIVFNVKYGGGSEKVAIENWQIE